jgi:putative phosphoribosyl transferase
LASQNADTRNLILGYFDASRGTAAALVAAATMTGPIKNQDQRQGEERPASGLRLGAIVSRNGRPDLARAEHLKNIRVPMLFIVGGNDYSQVISWNKNALRVLGSEKKKLVVVPNASHLFEEAGTLEEVARLASGWFRCYFSIMQHAIENS